MSWLSLLQGLVALVNGVVSVYERKQLLDAGEARVLHRSLKVSHERLKRAIDARRNAAVDPDSLHNDDGYKRPKQ